MNLLDALRLRNIFQNQQGPVGNDLPSQGGITGTMRVPQDTFKQPPLPAPPVMAEPEPEPAIFSSTTKSPRQYPIADKYFETIDTMPEREKPSWWRILLGAPAALGPNGGQVMDQIVHQPYYDKMRDWGTRNKILGEMAKIEGDINQTRSMDEYRDQTAEARMINAEAAQERAAVQREMLNGGQVKTNLAGEMLLVTRDGRVVKLNERTLSEEEKLKLQQEGRLQVIDAQEDAALKRIAAAGDQRVRVTREQGIQTRQNIGARAGGATQSDTQKAQMMRNRANEMERRWPHLARHLTLNPNTQMPDIEIQKPWPWQDPIDEATIRQQISDWLDKGIPPSEATPSPSPSQPVITPAQGGITRPDSTGIPNTPAPVKPQGTINSRITAGRTEAQWRQAAVDSLKRQGIPIDENRIKIAVQRLKEANGATAAKK